MRRQKSTFLSTALLRYFQVKKGKKINEQEDICQKQQQQTMTWKSQKMLEKNIYIQKNVSRWKKETTKVKKKLL